MQWPSNGETFKLKKGFIMTTLAIVFGLVLVGFGIGFFSCALSVSTRRKEDLENIEALEIHNEEQKNSIKCYMHLGFLEKEVIDNLTDECLKQKDTIDNLTAQIKDMKIIRTESNSGNFLNDSFFKNAQFLAENHHKLFMDCVDEILVDTFITSVSHQILNDYVIILNNGECIEIEGIEKLVTFVKNSYDLKQSLKASKN